LIIILQGALFFKFQILLGNPFIEYNRLRIRQH